VARCVDLSVRISDRLACELVSVPCFQGFARVFEWMVRDRTGTLWRGRDVRLSRCHACSALLSLASFSTFEKAKLLSRLSTQSGVSYESTNCGTYNSMRMKAAKARPPPLMISSNRLPPHGKPMFRAFEKAHFLTNLSGEDSARQLGTDPEEPLYRS